MTTLRTALLTASQTVWILSPSQRRLRQGRALRLRVQDIDEQRKLVESAANLNAEQEEARKKDLKQLKESREECVQLVADLGLAQSSLAKLNNTEIITEVAKVTHDDPTAASGAQLLWRTSSAAAHGQRMYATMRMNRNAVVGDTGKRVMVLQGDLVNDVGPIAAAATLAISEAFRLLDLRSGYQVEARQEVPDFLKRG